MKKISTKVKPLQTGGDGTAYYGEEVIDEKVMTKKDIKKRDEIADAISDKDMKDRYGDKSVKYAIATKMVMDKKKKKKDIKEAVPLLAKVAAGVIAKKVLSGKKKKKEKEETGPTTMVTKVVEELDKKDKPFVKKLVGKLRKGSKTHAKQADDLEKAMKENTAIESELVIQDWNSDDIKFTEIETVDIIKAKPLKESVDWRVQLIEKFGFSKNLGKFIIKGTKPLPKIKGKVKVPSGFTKYGAITPFRKSPITSIRPIPYADPVRTPLAKLKAQDVTKKTNIDKLTKKYKKVVKDPEFKSKVQKKYGVKPQLGGGKPVSKDGMIMPKPDEASKTNKLIDKYKIDKVNKTTDIGSEKKILDAQQDLDLKKLDRIDKAQDKLLDKINKSSPKAEKPKGFKKTDSGNYTRTRKPSIGAQVKSGVKKGLKIGVPALAGYALGKLGERPSDEVLPDDFLPDEKPMIKAKNEKKKKTVMASYDWRAELGEDWQKVNRQDKTDGLSKKAVKAYRRENPGSKLKTAVTKDPKKLKKGSKDAKRRLSFCRRMKGMKKRLTSAKTARDPDSRINKALRRWNC